MRHTWASRSSPDKSLDPKKTKLSVKDVSIKIMNQHIKINSNDQLFLRSSMLKNRAISLAITEELDFSQKYGFCTKLEEISTTPISIILPSRKKGHINGLHFCQNSKNLIIVTFWTFLIPLDFFLKTKLFHFSFCKTVTSCK